MTAIKIKVREKLWVEAETLMKEAEEYIDVTKSLAWISCKQEVKLSQGLLKEVKLLGIIDLNQCGIIIPVSPDEQIEVAKKDILLFDEIIHDRSIEQFLNDLKPASKEEHIIESILASIILAARGLGDVNLSVLLIAKVLLILSS